MIDTTEDVIFFFFNTKLLDCSCINAMHNVGGTDSSVDMQVPILSVKEHLSKEGIEVRM